MIVLHAGECDGSLFLWGESSGDGSAPPKRARVPRAGAYPFGAGTEELARALEGMPLGFKPAGRARRMAAWLPTRGGSPVPSSGIIAEPPASRARAKVAPWTVSAHRLSTEETVDILCASLGRRTVAPGVLVGADLAYWAEALRLAGSMVARQQFLPGLAADGKKHRAAWRPVFVGRDAEFLAGLARRMPPAGRALSESGAPRAPRRPTAEALGQVVAALTDHLVRTAAYGATPPRSRRRKHFDSIHDAWLSALKSPEGEIERSAEDVSQLASQIREWQRPVAVSASSPFRLCFRLEEPQDAAGTAGAQATVRNAIGVLRREPQDAANASDQAWFIRYLLQPHDDPSLLVPADKVWRARAGEIPMLERSGPNVREFLLLSLGQASGICPGIAESLEDAGMAGYATDTAGAHGFLAGEAAALEQAGYGVLLPSWWTRGGAKARLAARASVRGTGMRGGGGLSLDTVVSFDWEVALGDQKITIEELEELAREKSPLVRVRGQWMEMSAAEIRSAIDLLRKGAGRAAFRNVIRMEVGAEGAPGGLDFGGVRAEGRIAEVLNQLGGKANLRDIGPPEGFSGTLRPYQLRGYSWLSFLREWGLGGCLADDMGLGKTIQMLALMQRDWQAGERRPVLLVCPTSVMSNWQREAARFTPELPVLVHHGSGRMRGAQFKREAERHAVVVSSYGLVQRDAKFLRGVSWGGVVLDEAQNVKNPEAKQAGAARSLEADYRFALTGTPVENNVGDLWSIMEFLNPSLLGTQAEFKRNFFVPIQAEQDRGAAERLRRATGPFILRRLKTDRSVISDLPEKMEMKVFCPLTKEQASLYVSVLREAEEALDSAEGIQRRGMILATLSKLKQVCNHPAQFLNDNSSIANRSGKLARLTEMLEEVMEVGDRALVFSQFAVMGHILKRHIQETFGREVLFLHGGVPRGQRDRMVERFQDGSGGPQVFVLSLKAGGTGLNLTAASHVFHFDRWWNPAVENQATDRAFRIGQSRNVQVHKFVCAGTLEEKIDAMIERKKQVAEEVVGTGEGWLTELSNDDLREVLALSREAAGA